ncbi:MAG: polysaccharide deacetylase family protein, partial [Bacteroidetes bacterium]|nr:polysaccharide deacetylase family protein [Bacteroidota bacterium]
SFDIEEFDMPLEYGKDISFQDQMEISRKGTIIILDLLKKCQIKATFFSTVIFAQNALELIARIISEGHELASHTFYHSKFEIEHLAASKLALEQISGQNIKGLRMPRMQDVDHVEVRNAGYSYNSSLNPTWLPGRYNNFHKPRTYFTDNGVVQIPSSVSPIVRFPLFWLSFHNLPLWLYKRAAKYTLKKDKYLNLYFHPWEFIDLNDKKRFGFPAYVSRNTGKLMEQRIEIFINHQLKTGVKFGTFSQFIEIAETY